MTINKCAMCGGTGSVTEYVEGVVESSDACPRCVVNAYIRKPFRSADGRWCVVVTDSPSLLAEEIERIPCSGKDDAWQTYRRLKKEQGEML